MICIITIVRYPKYFGFLGILSMAIFHIPLFFNKKISFYKLLGSGKNGTFDIHPDWRQWAILTVSKTNGIENFESGIDLKDNQQIINETNGTFINCYFNMFNCTKETLILKPISSHGTWDNKEIFGKMPHNENNFNGKIAVLTRASIRLNKLQSFWKNVPAVAKQMEGAKGLIKSYGIGEIPFVKQATLSIWDDIADMKTFAYKMKEHQTVIQKTRKENWYSEEMFTRFEVVDII